MAVTAGLPKVLEPRELLRALRYYRVPHFTQLIYILDKLTVNCIVF